MLEVVAKHYIFLDNFCLNSPGYVFWLTKLKNDIKIALKATDIKL